MSRGIGVVSLKGGVGKTLIAVHLAHYLAEYHDTVLVDGEGVHGSLLWHERGEPFPFPVIGTEEYRPRDYKGFWQIFDTPAHPSEQYLIDLREVIKLAVIPVTLNVDSIFAVGQIAPFLQDGGLQVRTVVTNVPAADKVDIQMLKGFLEETGVPAYTTVLHRRKAYEYARHEGVPVYACSQRSRMQAWLEFTELGKEIVHGYPRP